MTCIVGVVKDGVTYLASDSFATSDYIAIECGEKIFSPCNNTIVGYAESYRMGQILQYCNVFDKMAKSKDHVGDMIRRVIPKMKKAMDDNIEPCALVGCGNSLMIVNSDYSVLEPKDKYFAIGSGQDYALSVLHVMKDIDMPVEHYMLMALETAAKFSHKVKGPFYSINTQSRKVKEIMIYDIKFKGDPLNRSVTKLSATKK